MVNFQHTIPDCLKLNVSKTLLFHQMHAHIIYLQIINSTLRLKNVIKKKVKTTLPQTSQKQKSRPTLSHTQTCCRQSAGFANAAEGLTFLLACNNVI